MNEYEIYTVNEENAGVRLDVFLASAAEISRSASQRMIEDGDVRVYDKNAREVRGVTKKLTLTPGCTVEFVPQTPESYEVLPENIPLDIVYEDDDIIVVNKPSGMVVHPAAGNENGTLVNALLYHCGDSLSGIGGVIRPGIVHRIDKNTSGLIAAAKNDAAHIALSEQLATHSMHRIYTALLVGVPKETEGTVNAPIGRHPTDRKKMAVIAGGGRSREAVTDYKVISPLRSREGERFALVECRLHTGRTHQIRVHMSYLHHPVAGDEVYGAGRTRFERANADLMEGQCLHARELVLTHPRTGEVMKFSSPLPQGFEEVLSKLSNEV